jgi:2'-5' RNA ligase
VPPVFTSFDDAWLWFQDGGVLTPMGRWRDRFTGGRAQLLSFQVPLADLPVADGIEAIQDELVASEAGEHLRLFDREMLHVSLRAAGFQVIAKSQPDDVSREDVARMAHDATAALRGRGPVEAALGPLNVFPDALILEVHDSGGLAALRDALAPVVADAFGLSDAQYLPHVTIAMLASADAPGPLRRVLPSLRERPTIAATLREVELARWWFTGVEDDDLPERDAVRTYRLRS